MPLKHAAAIGEGQPRISRHPRNVDRRGEMLIKAITNPAAVQRVIGGFAHRMLLWRHNNPGF